MRSVIVGAGPTGLYTAVALARRGHQVTVIDRDPGPDGGRWWDRKGVMQFHHPHYFRQQVADALLAEMPEVWRGLLAAGAVPAVLPGQPGVPAGLHCRRVTFERVLREAAQAEPGVRLRTGHVDEVCAAAGTRHRGQGRRPSGRRRPGHRRGRPAGRLTRALRRPAEGGDCGIAYVSRQYQMLPGAAAGPVNMPFGVIETYPGYVVAVFIHDNRILSALIARASTDRQLAALRTQRRVRGRRPGDPSPGGLDRSGASAAAHPGPAGRTAVQQLPGPAERRRPGRAGWADLRRGLGVHHQPGGRAGRDHLAAAGPAADQPARRARARFDLLLAGVRPLVRRPHQALVRRPRLLGRRPDPALVRPGRRPHPAPPAGPDHGRRRKPTRKSPRSPGPTRPCSPRPAAWTPSRPGPGTSTQPAGARPYQSARPGTSWPPWSPRQPAPAAIGPRTRRYPQRRHYSGSAAAATPGGGPHGSPARNGTLSPEQASTPSSPVWVHLPMSKLLLPLNPCGNSPSQKWQI